MAATHEWFYLDAQRQQQGPCSAVDIAARWQDGRLNDASMVWREGLRDWTALAELRSEFPVAEAKPAPTAAPNAYAPPRATLRDADDGPIDVNDIVPAGFLRRWVALFVDQVIISSVYYAVFFGLMMVGGAIGMGVGGGDFERVMMGTMMIAYPLYFLFAGAYFAGFESSAAQATPGKMVLGIKVVDMEGRRLSTPHALGRWAAAAVSYLTLYIGFLMAAFTEKKQALHDLIASTQVVDRWAYTAHPERQRRSLHGCVVAFLIGFVLIAVLGILAAIAIPSYQDYLKRARQSSALESGQVEPAPAAPVAFADAAV